MYVKIVTALLHFMANYIVHFVAVNEVRIISIDKHNKMLTIDRDWG